MARPPIIPYRPRAQQSLLALRVWLGSPMALAFLRHFELLFDKHSTILKAHLKLA